MNYNLNQLNKGEVKAQGMLASLRELLVLMQGEGKVLSIAIGAILINSALNLAGPFMVGYTIDHYIRTGDMHSVLVFSGILFLMYAVAFVANFFQMRLMGGVGQRVVWNLRNKIFKKLQELPIQFFNQNKAGDLISRINNDTELLNQFFSQYLTRFVDSVFSLTGIAITIIIISLKLGTAMLIPAFGLVVLTRLIGGMLKRRNKKSLQSIGGMSAEIQESLNNFKVIVAFNRRDYFKDKFEEANKATFTANMKASMANATIAPLYDFAANTAQLIVLCYGIYLMMHGMITLGIVVGFFTYAEKFYYPLRQFASIWTSFQLSLAGWDRISEVTKLESNLEIVVQGENKKSNSIMSFENVFFYYDNGESKKEVLKDITFDLERGKTYALVGPTGGGKTTTASLMARLFDPSQGTVYLEGVDIRSFAHEDRTQKIGFILQEPFLFNGTVRENILYGSNVDTKIEGFDELICRFDSGLDTVIKGSGEGISLGQKQIIAFIRAIVRRPEILILDEATANIDTVTESLLQDALCKLPKETTKVIIAHRLNTIKNADEIFFVGGGSVTPAGSFDHAVDMLLHNKSQS